MEDDVHFREVAVLGDEDVAGLQVALATEPGPVVGRAGAVGHVLCLLLHALLVATFHLGSWKMCKNSYTLLKSELTLSSSAWPINTWCMKTKTPFGDCTVGEMWELLCR